MRRMLLSISVSLTVVLFSLSLTSTTANAGARDFFKCKLTDGTKKEAMEKLVSEYMKIVRKEGIKDYSMELLWPMYSADISRGTFFWAGAAPTAARIAAMEEFFGESDANKDLRQKFGDIATCESGSIYKVSKIK